jgi:mono/diheme cytochrome c family protein
MFLRPAFVLLVMWGSFLVNPVLAVERHIMAPRVPADKIEEARVLVNPLQDSPDMVEKGKAIYEGKGTCFNCHGNTGRGDGPGGVSLNPSPRNFWQHGMWRHRTEGEIFWVIKYGSPGTAMIPFGGLLTDEEIWTVMQYERSFSKGRGPGGMGRHRGMGRRGNDGLRGPQGMGKPHRRHGGQDECCSE